MFELKFIKRFLEIQISVRLLPSISGVNRNLLSVKLRHYWPLAL